MNAEVNKIEATQEQEALKLHIRDLKLLDFRALYTLISIANGIKANAKITYEKTIDFISPQVSINGKLHCYFKEYKVKGYTLYEEILSSGNEVLSSLNLEPMEQKAFIFDAIKKIVDLDGLNILHPDDHKVVLNAIGFGENKVPLGSVALDKMPKKVEIVKSVHGYYIPRLFAELLTLDTDVALPVDDSLFNDIVTKQAEEKAKNTYGFDAFQNYLQIKLNKTKV